MEKVFISIPTKGISPEKINKNISYLLRAAASAVNGTIELIDGFVGDKDKSESLEVLGENIKRMNDADYVVFGEGFENDKGCMTEYNIANRYWKKILIEHGNKLKEVV